MYARQYDRRGGHRGPHVRQEVGAPDLARPEGRKVSRVLLASLSLDTFSVSKSRTKVASAIFDASVARANIDSP